MKKFDRKEFMIGLLTGAALAALVFWIEWNRGYILLRCLTDATFVPAVLLLGAAGLRLARNDGTFDSAGFGIKTAFLTMFPALKKQDEDLIEYKERKAKTRKSPFNLFLSGLVFLVLSLVLFVIYMTVKQSA